MQSAEIGAVVTPDDELAVDHGVGWQDLRRGFGDLGEGDEAGTSARQQLDLAVPIDDDHAPVSVEFGLENMIAAGGQLIDRPGEHRLDRGTSHWKVFNESEADSIRPLSCRPVRQRLCTTSTGGNQLSKTIQPPHPLGPEILGYNMVLGYCCPRGCSCWSTYKGLQPTSGRRAHRRGHGSGRPRPGR